MPKRYPNDLSHFSFSMGDIGKLQTLTTIPIVAGDGVDLNFEGVFRLSPLRRQLIIDCKVDLFAFFVPHRHIYGDSWIDFMKDGMRETETFAGFTAIADLSYLGSRVSSGETMPLWLLAGYNRIWNRFFRSPTDDQAVADTFAAVTSLERISGLSCGHLPVPWSTGVMDGVTITNRDVDTTGNSFDIADLNRIQAAYRTDVEREYFGVRYNDIMKTAFGTKVSTDADERPTLIARSTFWLSGHDVDGTGDANLGAYSGKSVAVASMGFRRKYFGEHGALRIMVLPRFPVVHVQERPFLNTLVNPTYLQISGDPQVVGAEPPDNLRMSDYFAGGSGATIGQVPFGAHYHYHPSVVHQGYASVEGYSFLKGAISSRDKANYIADTEYDSVFQTLQLRQWNVAGRMDVNVMRVTPPTRGSLFAGG